VTVMADEGTRRPWHVRLRLLPLKGWITTGEAAQDLGISREAVHRLIQRGTIGRKDARTVGRRPIIVVRERAVRELPVSPQRRRELGLRGARDAELGDGLPGG
jgi:excisionase family DNA binding protein